MTSPKQWKPNWQVILSLLAISLALISLFVPYHISFLERDYKALRVTILANSSLLEVERSIREDIDITYKKEKIDNLSFVQVKVENAGNRAIAEDDYERGKPLQLIFPQRANILDAVVLDRSPKDVAMTVKYKQNVATLSSTLLNQGERVIVEVLLANMPTDKGAKLVDKEGRIKSGNIQLVSAIEQKDSSKRTSIDWLDIILLLLLVPIVFLLAKSLINKLLERPTRSTK